jgi:glycine/D-amino acid oxidase-like deaminating enzyme
VLADRVVVCTNGYTGQLVPELSKAWCPLVAFCLSTKPLPAEVRRSVLPSDAVISQFPTGTHPTLIDGHDRLVTSLLPSPIRPEASGPALAWFQRWLHRMFPQTRGVELELDSYWTGSMAWSTDTLPRVFEVSPGLLALTCFSGEGNVLAPLLGRHLAEALANDALDRLALPVRSPEVPRWRGQYDLPLRKLAIPLMKFAERLRLY